MKSLRKPLIGLGLVALVAWWSLIAQAHEPLYGLGPHTLFKHGFAPHLTVLYDGNLWETEYALGYGITENWTVIGETAWEAEGGHYGFEHFNLKTKYRFWMKNVPGKSSQIAAVARGVLPLDSEKPFVIPVAITGGQESLKWFWYAGAGYAFKAMREAPRPGNHFFYNATIGYRPMKAHYRKPDIVFFIETVGEAHQAAINNGKSLCHTGGHILSVAPTFFFTWRNLAVRGGVQFKAFESGYLDQPDINGKLTIELHL